MAVGGSQPGSGSDSRRQSRDLRLHVTDKKSGIEFLVDSGSILSLLPRSQVTQKLVPRELRLTAANGSNITTYGQHILVIDLGLRRPLTWVFTVADVRSAILGADFLAHYDLVVSLNQRQFDLSTPGRRQWTSAADHGPRCKIYECITTECSAGLSSRRCSTTPHRHIGTTGFLQAPTTNRRQTASSKGKLRHFALPRCYPAFQQPMGQPAAHGATRGRRLEDDRRF